MTLRYRRALCWIRRDLRLQDHSALSAATKAAESVAVVFVFDTNILDALPDRDDRRVTFIHRSLEELDRKLRQRGSLLLVRHGNPTEEIPRLAEELGADVVFAARDYEPYARERDRTVAERLAQVGCCLKTVKDQVIFEGDEILNQSGQPFKVFTPYMRAWRTRFHAGKCAEERGADLRCLIPLEEIVPHEHPWSLENLGFQPNALWLEPGEDAAHERLRRFAEKIHRYAETRDFPGQEGTSGLSVHLRFGTISVRACIRASLSESKGADKWLNELIWRDFYQMILYQFPHVVELPFQAQYGGLEYPGLDEAFEGWCEGRTGYPIVDAAMRCLNATGRMHNRLRMVVASFLTKDLLVDYRKGEAYFARKLLDFELASNNGGWQWAASTGVDSQPYFRVFNPVRQSEKFDSDGTFIRRWCPELREFPRERIHWSHNATLLEQVAASCEIGKDYPHPIVDHQVQREQAVRLMARVSNPNAS